MENSKKYLSEYLETGPVKSYIVSITTNPKFRLNGFRLHFYCNSYIRVAGGLLHKSQGLSLFLESFRLFHAPTWISSLQNNDK